MSLWFEFEARIGSRASRKLDKPLDWIRLVASGIVCGRTSTSMQILMWRCRFYCGYAGFTVAGGYAGFTVTSGYAGFNVVSYAGLTVAS